MKRTGCLYVEAIRVRPLAGTNVRSAIREALILALEEEGCVELEFNNKVIKITTKPIIEGLVEQYDARLS